MPDGMLFVGPLESPDESSARPDGQAPCDNWFPTWPTRPEPVLGSLEGRGSTASTASTSSAWLLVRGESFDAIMKEYGSWYRIRGISCSSPPFRTTSRLEMTDQLPVPRSKNHSPILRIVGLAVVGMAGQSKSDGYSAVLFWNEYIALSTKVRKGVPIPLPFFALMT